MAKSRLKYHLIAFGLGLILVPVKLLYSFVPFSNVLDVILFGYAGRYFGKRWPDDGISLGLTLSIPALLGFAYLTFFVIGLPELQAGVGIGWAISIVLIPASAFLGAVHGRKSGRD